ncbi:prevent-host-death protein [Chryseobacterium sp. 09-1422]|uniref:Prevent-host-death protein n=1 Tax=Chryseobacterium kimseyorum TaxID=2984028 RepID=A0ABT3I3J3_9FLAO|nr:prevent-host-death protein [Chryseobacterium kimseyorum]MCW3170635.1 prevent-host-death protein [Chryseobacterium kimseyorum]
MNYKLEINTQDPSSSLVFNMITFESFKINIIERYAGRMNLNPKLIEVFVKVRTLNDQLVKKIDGNSRIRVIGDDLTIYAQLSKDLQSVDISKELKNKLTFEQDYVYFILKLVLNNYELNSALSKST